MGESGLAWGTLYKGWTHNQKGQNVQNWTNFSTFSSIKKRAARFIWRFLIWVPLLPGWMIRGNLRNDCRTVASQLRNHYDASLDFNDPVRHFKIIISLESPLYWILSLWNYVIHFRPRGIWSNQKHWCTLNSENYDLFLNVWILKYEQSEILAWNLDKFVIILYKVNTP